jgi:hypothetical protein
MLTPEQHPEFVAEQPDVFVPIRGGWGATHIKLAAANENLLRGALQAAWKVRIEKNSRTRTRKESRPLARRSTHPDLKGK